MAERIELPAIPAGDAERQLQDMYRYLYRMAETLNANLTEIGGMDLTDDERRLMNSLDVTPAGEYASFSGSEAESLKSLIIKTAAWAKNMLEEYRISLLGEYVAEGKFGKYVQNTKMNVDVTPTGITQEFKFHEIIEDLKKYEINAKNYIKTGLLRTEQSLPIYGVAVGKDIVTFSQDGTETYNDGNKVAEFTADHLSFFHSNTLMAKFTGTELTFYANGSERVTMDSNGITFLDGAVKLAELLSTSLKFYRGGNLRLTVDNDGIKLTRSSTKLADFVYDGITLYYRGTKRAVLDSTGLSFSDGNTKLAEMTTSALNFYYNGSLRSVFGSNGIAFSKGNQNIAAMNADGISIYCDGKLRSHVDDGHYDLYDKNEKLALRATTDGVGVFSADAMRATFTANGIGFWVGSQYHEIEVMYFDPDGEIHAAYDLNISAGKKVNIGDWSYDSNGAVYKMATNKYFMLGKDTTWQSGQTRYKILATNTGIQLACDYPNSVTPSTKQTYVADLYGTDFSEQFDGTTSNGALSSIFRCEILCGNLSPRFHNTDQVGGSARYYYRGYIRNFYYYQAAQQSSRDVKHNIQPMPEIGEKLDQLQPVTFIYDDDAEEKTRSGLIYEDTIDVMPEICTVDDDKKGINYVELIPMLLKEIQNLRTRVNELENKVQALERR